MAFSNLNITSLYKPGGLPGIGQEKAVVAGQLGVAGILQMLHHTDEAQTPSKRVKWDNFSVCMYDRLYVHHTAYALMLQISDNSHRCAHLRIQVH